MRTKGGSGSGGGEAAAAAGLLAALHGTRLP